MSDYLFCYFIVVAKIWPDGIINVIFFALISMYNVYNEVFNIMKLQLLNWKKKIIIAKKLHLTCF